MNTISFIGRLGKDAELKDISGTSCLSFSVASDVGFKDKKTTNWFRCAVWGKQADALHKYLTKGTKIMVCGELTARPYDETKVSLDVRVDRIEFAGGEKKSEDERPVAAPRTVVEEKEEVPF